MKRSLYEQPVHVDSAAQCNFYLTTDIPGVGRVDGQWDLREGVDEYLGGYDFSGQRVLETGPATGFLTFHMERAAREVVAVELPLDRGFWNAVPYQKLGLARREPERTAAESLLFEHIDRTRPRELRTARDRLDHHHRDALPRAR